MKKVFINPFTLTMLFVLSFISCSSDNDNKDESQNSSWIGTWTASYEKMEAKYGETTIPLDLFLPEDNNIKNTTYDVVIEQNTKSGKGLIVKGLVNNDLVPQEIDLEVSGNTMSKYQVLNTPLDAPITSPVSISSIPQVVEFFESMGIKEPVLSNTKITKASLTVADYSFVGTLKDGTIPSTLTLKASMDIRTDNESINMALFTMSKNIMIEISVMLKDKK